MVIDDEPPQPRSLEIKVCEVGESQEASLGLVHLDLNPMMFKEGTQKREGWFPIYSVDKGITGELYIEILLDFIADHAVENQFQIVQQFQQR